MWTTIAIVRLQGKMGLAYLRREVIGVMSGSVTEAIGHRPVVFGANTQERVVKTGVKITVSF